MTLDDLKPSQRARLQELLDRACLFLRMQFWASRAGKTLGV
jgi:hypothetical protein